VEKGKSGGSCFRAEAQKKEQGQGTPLKTREGYEYAGELKQKGERESPKKLVKAARARIQRKSSYRKGL